MARAETTRRTRLLAAVKSARTFRAIEGPEWSKRLPLLPLDVMTLAETLVDRGLAATLEAAFGGRVPEPV